MTMAREAITQEGSTKFAGSKPKPGRAVRGKTIRFPDAETEGRYNKYMAEFGGPESEGLGALIKKALSDMDY